MKCQTKWYGLPCKNDATYWVSGGCITPHPSCTKHTKTWLVSPETDPKKIPPVIATPLDHTNYGCH